MSSNKVRRMDTLSWIITGAAVFSMLVTGATAWVAVRSHQEGTSRTNAILNRQQETIDRANGIMSSQLESLQKANEMIGMSEGIIRSQRESVDQATQIIAMQRESIEENEYRNFRSGIVYDERHIESEIREWFDRVKAFGINPPRPPKMILIKLSHRTSSLEDYRTAPTKIFNNETKVVIFSYRNSISIWRGLTHVLLGKEIQTIPDARDYSNNEIPPGPNELMYDGFLLENYESASNDRKSAYWAAMLDLTYVE